MSPLHPVGIHIRQANSQTSRVASEHSAGLQICTVFSDSFILSLMDSKETVPMNQAERETRRRKRILEHARTTRNVIKTCRYFGVSGSTFYLWRRAYQA